ncbi:hypothetical protein SKP52_02510 [Sphingopyxis fribergensis]|uniref:Replication protein n=1 Tax=Sphingopyxis fribergensis TaxID=1515612 RepID=A0A0A7PHK9_9SPHN|nr:hypothetical protein [Sphingopyxis fribergensis]AJA07437.1 hypothetical protein SKP52_02510 [Sphingopyxis fribergensis]
MSGFAVLYREATDHPLFAGDSSRFGAWAWLVLKACWKPTKFNVSGSTMTIQRGQLCVSRSQLATAWGWSQSAVERFLTRLQTEQMIGRATGQGRSIITICNYEKYQDIAEDTGQETGQPSGQRSDSDRTTKEQGNHITIEEEAKASPSTARAARRKKAEPFVRPDWIPAEPWTGYVAMRVKIRKPMTDEAKYLAVGKLAKLAKDGHPPGDVLNQSIFNSYQGLFEIKDQGNGQSAQPFRKPTTLDAMQRALELTGGTEGCDAPRSPSGNWGANSLPDPVRAIGHVGR